MHHRQLQMGGGVVHGQAPGFGDDDDRQGDERQHTGQRGHQTGVMHRIDNQGTEIRGSGRDREGEDGQQNRRFDQRGDGDLPAGAHAAERCAGVDPGKHKRDGPEEQQTDDGEQIGGRVER